MKLGAAQAFLHSNTFPRMLRAVVLDCSSAALGAQTFRGAAAHLLLSTFHEEEVWKTSACQPRASHLNWESKCPGHVATTGVSPRERSHLSAAPGCRTAVGC